MIKVSNETKKAFMSDVSKKNISVIFPELGLVFQNDSIETESLKLTESISTKDSVEFVGCIASNLQINIYNVDDNIKGKKIEVYINANGIESIPLFKGIVDSVVIESNRFSKKITAYDVLYTVGQTDIVGWYNQQFPTDDSTKTLKELRDSVFQYIGIPQVDTKLPNDNIVIGKKFNPKTLKCITVLKSICQINGCCGIINRLGQFDYRFITTVRVGTIPSIGLYPNYTTFAQETNISHHFAFYETLNYQEYFVRPMERVQIRQTENDIGVTVGEGSNKYIIQSNMFAQEMLPSVAEECARNILQRLRGVKFYPFNSKNNGLPFVEVGDAVVFYLKSDRTGSFATNKFLVLNRTLSGIQLLKDQYNASGSEEQSEFVTDLQTTLDTLKMNGGSGGGDMSDYYTKDQINDLFTQVPTMDDVEENVAEQVNQMQIPTGFNVVSTYTLPSTRANNTIYAIQSGVIVL